MPNHVFAREIRNTQILGRMCERAMYQRPKPHAPLEDDPCVDFIIKKFDLQGDDDMPAIIRKMAAARAAEAAEAASRADFLPPLEFFDSGVPLPPLEFSDSTASAAVDENFESVAFAAVNKNFESTAFAVVDKNFESDNSPRPGTSALSVDAPRPKTSTAKRPKIAVADEPRHKTSTAKRPRTAVADEPRPKTSAAKRPKTNVADEPLPKTSAAKRHKTADVGFQETAVFETADDFEAVDEFQGTAAFGTADDFEAAVADGFQGTRPKTSAAKRSKKTADAPKPPAAETIVDGFQETDEIPPATARQPGAKFGSVVKPLPKTADQKLEARNKLYKKAADFLLQCRYKRPENDVSVILLDFKDMDFTGPRSIRQYLKDSTTFVNHFSNKSINAYINQGFAIEAQCKADKKADKKIKKKDSYLQLANFLNLKGNEDVNMRWFQRRQALAKISDILDLFNFSYSCTASDLMNIAPQIFNANKLGYFDE
jgi:hypothetical protein